MQRPRVEEVDFHDFMRILKSARDSRCVIEKADKEKWSKHVTENNIRDVSLEAHGKVRFANGAPTLVAIIMDSDWDGCYAYSQADEAAIRYIP